MSKARDQSDSAGTPEDMGDDDQPDPIEYLTKSRLTDWVKCERKFYYKHIQDMGTDEETEALRRGSEIHETIEKFYENLFKYVEEHGTTPDHLLNLLPDDTDLWQEWLDPYITSFLAFEDRRRECASSLETYLPIEIEEKEYLRPPATVNWMGYADVLLHADSLPNAPVDHGVVILDFKTGSVPHENYRDEGIHLEGEYYAMLFEQDYDVTAVAGYYPKKDEAIYSHLKSKRRGNIIQMAMDIEDRDHTNPDAFDIDEQPICCWGEEEGDRCEFYDECPSTWAVPVDKKERTIELLRAGKTNEEIAEVLGTSEDAVDYWIRKLSLYRYKPETGT